MENKAYDGRTERQAQAQMEQLVADSRQQDSIEHAEWAPALEDAFLGRADLEDSVENGNVMEFWGPGYRVHLSK